MKYGFGWAFILKYIMSDRIHVVKKKHAKPRSPVRPSIPAAQPLTIATKTRLHKRAATHLRSGVKGVEPSVSRASVPVVQVARIQADPIKREDL